MKPPDFIIGGAPRCGTTWLYCLLQKHPNIYMAKPLQPEPKFFLVDELYERGLEYYLQTWFADTGQAKLAGEKSTNYLESATAAVRIHKHLPSVKLIFILRDPVERAFSNYLWSRQNGWEDQDFATAISLEEKRLRELPQRLRYARPFAYYQRGLYAEQLRVYFDLFGREQILCLRYEDIAAQPVALAERVHRFLNVEVRPHDADGLGVINAAEARGEPMPAEIREQLRARYSEPNRKLAELLGPEFQIWSYA